MTESNTEHHERWGSSSFVVGDHVGLVGRHVFGIIEAGHPSTQDRLWSFVEAELGLDDVLDELSSAGLRSLPSFAVAQLTGRGVRAVARGSARVDVVLAGGDERSLDGSSVGTWLEGAFDDVERLAVTLGPTAATDHEPAWFVLAGLVPARRVERDLLAVDPFADRAQVGWRPSRSGPHDGGGGVDDDVEIGSPVPDHPVGATEPDVGPAEDLEPAGPPAEERVEQGSGVLIRSVPTSTPTGQQTLAPDRFDDGESGSAAGGAPLGEHDGSTVDRSAAAAIAEASAVDRISALVCDLGHASPPQAGHCRVCGAPLGGRSPELVELVALAVLAFSDGTRVTVDRNVLLGRDPRVGVGAAAELPHILRFGDLADGLSRTHAEIRVEGWQLVLEDLKSTNGTKVTLPNQPQRHLDGGQSIVLVPGTVIEFDVDLTCVVEATR